MTSGPRLAHSVSIASDQSHHSEVASNRSIRTFESTSVELIGLVAKQRQQVLAAHPHLGAVLAQVLHDALGLCHWLLRFQDRASAFDDELDLGVRQQAEPLA